MVWVDSIYSQLSIESKNAQVGARMKNIWPSEAEREIFQDIVCSRISNLGIFSIPNGPKWFQNDHIWIILPLSIL